MKKSIITTLATSFLGLGLAVGLAGCAAEDGESISLDEFANGTAPGSVTINVGHLKIPCDASDGCLSISLAGKESTPVPFDKPINGYDHQWGNDATLLVELTIDGENVATYTAVGNVTTKPVSSDAEFVIKATDLAAAEVGYEYLEFPVNCTDSNTCSLLSDAIGTDGATVKVKYNNTFTQIVILEVDFGAGQP